MTVVADLHCDLLIDLDHRRVRGERDVFRHRHLEPLRAAGVRVQVLAIFVQTAYLPEGALRTALRLVDAALREEEESEGALRLVGSRRELDDALAGEAIAGILSFEGVEALGRDPGLIRVFHRLGVRMASLTWNRANDMADGIVEDRGVGVTPLGERLLGEMAAARMALDLSHLSPRGVEQALVGYDGPICASHCNAASLYANARNVSDDVLRALAERGGVAGVNVQRAFLGPGDPAERLAAHARRMAEVAGWTLPGFGCDFTAFLPERAPEPAGLGLPPGSDRSLQELGEADRATVYAEAANELRAAGAGDAQVEAVLGGNAVRFLRTALT